MAHTVHGAEKKEFDLAMAKELSQVAISEALRILTAKENNDPHEEWRQDGKGPPTAQFDRSGHSFTASF